MKMAESEIMHRQEMDRETLEADIVMTNVEVKTEAIATIAGQILGFPNCYNSYFVWCLYNNNEDIL